MPHLRVVARAVVTAFVALALATRASGGPAEDLAAAYARADYAAAIAILEPLARAGDADAGFNLGVHYNRGLGVDQNPATAATWFRSAAEKGHAAAMAHLGVLYLDGRGVKEDAAEALRLFRAAAEKDNDLAQRPFRNWLSGVQLVEQSLGLLQIACVETLGKPAVNRSEKRAGLIPLALLAPEPRHAHRGA